MARGTTVFVCSQCGHSAAKWHGQCPECDEWNTLAEERAPARAARGSGPRSPGGAVEPTRLRDVSADRTPRLPTGIEGLDRLLGGGVVPGSLVLVGGSPGIGKSTLTTMALGLAEAAGRRTLYISGEESAAQIRLRAERLEAGSARGSLAVPVMAETGLEAILATIEAERPELCVVDSVQTIGSAELTGAPGTVGQVREAASRLMELSKRTGTAILLVGHVTKEGSLAGPRVLEHLVDCVLQFDGERERTYRTLRALKNRFGATSDVAVFEMDESGLTEVVDASARFVEEATRAPGSVILAAMEGSRPLLVEVQALVSPSEVIPPRRVVNGIDRNRLALVLAVLARHAGISTSTSDVFVNVVGGVRIDEPGADLAIALAVAGAASEAPLAEAGRLPACAFGEVGLNGELRSVAHHDRRAAEAARFGLGEPLSPSRAGTLREALSAARASPGAAPERQIA